MPTVLFQDHKTSDRSLLDRIAAIFSPRFRHVVIIHDGAIFTWLPDQGVIAAPIDPDQEIKGTTIDTNRHLSPRSTSKLAWKLRGIPSVVLGYLFPHRFYNCGSYAAHALGIKQPIRTPDQLYDLLDIERRLSITIQRRTINDHLLSESEHPNR
jgi:hypothetical protein